MLRFSQAEKYWIGTSFGPWISDPARQCSWYFRLNIWDLRQAIWEGVFFYFRYWVLACPVLLGPRINVPAAALSSLHWLLLLLLLLLVSKSQPVSQSTAVGQEHISSTYKNYNSDFISL